MNEKIFEWKTGDRFIILKNMLDYKKGDKGTITDITKCKNAKDCISTCCISCGGVYKTIRMDNGFCHYSDCYGYGTYLFKKIGNTLKSLVEE